MLQAKHIENCRLVVDRVALLDLLPKGGVIAEVGVLAGDFSEKILEVVRPGKFYLLDLFESDDWAWTGRFTAEHHQEFVTARFESLVKAGDVEVRQGNSWELLDAFPDEHFDWIYIDADHSYESVKKDLAAARLKVKPGGLIVMNDYVIADAQRGDPYGVMHATNEFCMEEGWELVYMALQEHSFNDVVLKQLER